MTVRRSLVLCCVVLACLVAPTAAPALPAPGDPCDPFTALGPPTFTAPTEIDNPLFPLTPGTQLILQGTANRGGGFLDHTVVFTVTDVVKEINGVETRVLWDVDLDEGQLTEEELAFFAQDDAGTVWNLGEYPEEYEGGHFAGAPSTWIDGSQDAVGGVHMPGRPVVGEDYLQGSAPEIDFLDCATIVEEGASTCVPAGCFSGGLVTHERSPLDPDGGIQTKFHAPGIGIVQVGALDDPEGETLVLTEQRTLGLRELGGARRAALRLDRRAYRNAEVYRDTPLASAPSWWRGGSGGRARLR